MGSCVKVRDVLIGEGIPKICVPIAERTKEEIISAARAVKETPFDLVEWRADWFVDVFDFKKVQEVLEELRSTLDNAPILFTFRTSKEGGEKSIEPSLYMELNSYAASTGLIDLMDVEIFTGDFYVSEIINHAHDDGVFVIASNHDFNMTPDKEEIITRLCRMQDMGADIMKIAVMPQSKKDVLTVLEATEEMAYIYTDKPIVAISMSETGLISRLCGEVFGSAISFGTAGKASAPGQINTSDLKTVLNIIHNNI